MPTTEMQHGSMAILGKDSFTLTRTFDAPRELVFRAWTEPELFARWWGPIHYTTPVCKIDPRVGGTFLACMRSPEGEDFWSGGRFTEIDPPSKLAYVDYFTDSEGNKVPPSAYGMSADFPDETMVTLTFEDVDGKTKLTMVNATPESAEERSMAIEGMAMSWDKLAEALKSM